MAKKKAKKKVAKKKVAKKKKQFCELSRRIIRHGKKHYDDFRTVGRNSKF